MKSAPELFVWRGRLTVYDWLSPYGHNFGPDPEYQQLSGTLYRDYDIKCPFCGGDYSQDGPKVDKAKSRCRRCGFWHSSYEGAGDQDQWANAYISSLKRIHVDDADLGLDELGTHLRRRYGDIFDLSPLTFERLVEDVYRHLGYRTRRTQMTRDGGYDIVLMEKGNENQILVECKRYARTRKVGVGVVRHLLGVMLVEDFRAAKLVTTSEYTRPAQEVARLVESSGYLLELVDGGALLNDLAVYNTALPPLHSIHIRDLGQDRPTSQPTAGPAEHPDTSRGGGAFSNNKDS